MQEKKNYSQLKAMKAIAVASFRSIIRNPSAVVFSIAFPLVFIVAFGFINGNSIKMEVGIEDCLHIEFEFDKQKYHLQVSTQDLTLFFYSNSPLLNPLFIFLSLKNTLY